MDTISNVEAYVLSLSKEELETAKNQIDSEVVKTEFGDMAIVRHQKIINTDGKPYEVGVDIGEGKDYTRVVVIGDSGCKEALAEIAQLKERGIDVVCVNMDTENMEVLRGFTGITIATSPEMILAFKKASLDYANVICLGHIDEETKVVPPMPTGVKEIAYIPIEPLIESYCPRKNDNKPWYSRFDKRKRR